MSVLKVTNLEKNFRLPQGELRPVIDIPDFELGSGEHLALSGGSGSGKTTFLHLLSGIYEADSGSIELDGEEMTRKSESQRDTLRSRKIGYVFQTFNLLQGYTCLENVLLGMRFGAGVNRPFAKALLERVGLSERVHDYPRQLSVGQQQRVAVARALANRPKLVLADEPTGNLDSDMAQLSLKIIRDMCLENNAALLLVSHDEAILNSFERQKKLSDFNKVPAEGGRQ